MEKHTNDFGYEKNYEGCPLASSGDKLHKCFTLAKDTKVVVCLPNGKEVTIGKISNMGDINENPVISRFFNSEIPGV